MRETPDFEWRLNEDGGGTLYHWRDVDGLAVEQDRRIFDSLDRLPETIAKIIRGDGRMEGEYPPAE